MTATTTDCAESAPETTTQPSPWPLAEETLTACPAIRDYYATRDDFNDLYGHVADAAAPDLLGASGIRAAFMLSAQRADEEIAEALRDVWPAEPAEPVTELAPLPDLDSEPQTGEWAQQVDDAFATERAADDFADGTTAFEPVPAARRTRKGHRRSSRHLRAA